MESVNIVVVFGATTKCVTFSVTGVDLIVVPISARVACALSLGKKLLHNIILNKDNKYKKQYEEDQQAIRSFDKLQRKSLQHSLIDQNEYESICNIFNRYIDE